MWENCEQRAFFCFFFQMCNCGCTQTGNREASRPVGSQGVVRTDRPLSTSPSPPPACFLIPPSASFWGWSHCVETSLPTRSHKLPPHLPHPLPASLACSQVVGIPTACSAMIWLMEFDFQRGSLKRVWLFGRARDETGGRRGSWEGGDAWRAEAESCQLDSGSAVSL